MPSKPSIAEVRASNHTASWSYRPTAVFVGGTSGVGEAAAKAFAEATKGFAHIIIVGRSRSRAEAVIESFPKGSDSKYDFLSCDVTDMRNITSAAKDITEKLNVTKINYLALSQGGYPLGPNQPCLNGIDRRMVLEFYSRWKFIDELLPLLELAATTKEEARVLIIKGPTQKQVIDPEDFGLRKNSSALVQTKATCIYNNMFVEEYSKLHPTVSFCHMFPGLVDTPAFDTAQWWMRLTIFLARLFGFMISPDDSGQRLLYAMLRPEYKTGGFCVDLYAEPTEAPRENQAVRDALMEHYKQEVST
ncbi:hypothetical protein FRB90_011084 [Tulasnella sp. 427]|nr:hypothetical protein FRB90_011084 [Tulasnella sp. 427]